MRRYIIKQILYQTKTISQILAATPSLNKNALIDWPLRSIRSTSIAYGSLDLSTDVIFNNTSVAIQLNTIVEVDGHSSFPLSGVVLGDLS